MAEISRRVGAKIFVARRREIRAAPKFSQPRIHDLDHQGNSKARMMQERVDAHLPDTVGGCRIPPTQLHKIRDEGVARIAREEDNRRSSYLRQGDEILPAQTVPRASLGQMLEAIVRIDDAWNFRRATIGDDKGKLPASFLAKIGAEKCAHPGSSAFRNRKDDGIAVGELGRATAEIPSRTEHITECATGAEARPA